MSTKKMQAHVTEFATKEPNLDPETVKKTKSTLLSIFYSNTKNTAHGVTDLKRLLSWKENPSDIVKETDHKEADIIDIFGPNMNMIELVKANEDILKKKGQYLQKTQLSLFRGDISLSIRDAIKEKRVNPLVISLAPMVSPKLWQEACETYADQLSIETDADPIEAATYYLACHKVDKAIEILCDRSLFREALALAKCRLMENDDTVHAIIEKWGKYTLLTGNFEVSAQCSIFLGKYAEAASVLFRRSNLETLEFAAELAQKSKNDELYKAIMIRYNAFSSVNSIEPRSETENKYLIENVDNTQVLSSVEIDILPECTENGDTPVLSKEDILSIEAMEVVLPSHQIKHGKEIVDPESSISNKDEN